ncbi:hypothetical protein [Dolichospermum sp. LEGE 00246]|uniref:COG1470 family protein n=1 Tax=Dolichospermum sp. LEGE 00246 TaxID=1828605 RepID=UPI0018812500|nr:hypothetical protein [Dolichospermum sp. LEGE 00246]MBE9259292.1 hypothetical protein [Dolichospermum sp. LEGE 00246]
MQAQTSPLQIIINPTGMQFGMPGDTIELYVVVINQGNQSAVVDLYFSFDDQFTNLMGWSVSPQESLAIAPQQTSDEVKFQLHIPHDALPGTYDYTLVVDAPQHYPQDTPINFPMQLKVQIKEQTVIRINDPTFSLKPSSNTNKPLILNPSQPLQIGVIVENRSNLVDRFRITCLDLDEDWFTINYPTTGAEGTGLSEVTALSLNPRSQGQIFLTFHPPGDSLAGIYSPTIRLHSENSPDLVLLDLVYTQIPTIYRLDVQLQTILAQVSRSPAKYELSLTNQGNVVRELKFALESRDEEALYNYKFEPSEIRLLPNKNYTSNLTVKPRPWWRRPWSGGGLVINFQAQIQDKNNLPLNNTLPQLSFIWKPRPWWQFLLLILVCLGLFGGISFIIWRLLNPDPVILEEFFTSSPKTEDKHNEVKLSWKIRNYQNLQSVLLTIAGNQTKYYFSKDTLKDTQGNKLPCQPEKEYLSCDNFSTGVKKKGKYSFELQASYRKGALFFSQDTKTAPQIKQVEISEKEIAEVSEFKTDRPQYTKGNNINLSWKISRPLLLKEIQITGKAEDGTSVGILGVYRFNQDNQGNMIFDSKLQNLCAKTENQQLECRNIPISLLKAGRFTFEIKALPNNDSDRSSLKKTESAIEILPKPFRIVSFTLNSSEQPNQELKEGATAILSWRVEGEDIQVKLDPFGNVPAVGSKSLEVNSALPSQIKLQVNDKLGKQQPQEKAFAIAVIKKVEPTVPPPFILPAPQTTPVFPSF